MRLARSCLSMAAALMLLPAWGQGGHALPLRSLTAGVYLITAEVASDDEAREIGLMYRQDLAPNHGMLFVFDTAEKTCMWMRNTLIPLSVAFIDFDGRVVNIEDMAPQTDSTHCAQRPVPYALEMTRGWFSERGLRAAQTIIGGLPPVPRKQ